DIVNTLDDILPTGPTPQEAARAIYVTAIGETTSRREATLIDLHELDKKLQRRLKRDDRNAGILLLQRTGHALQSPRPAPAATGRVPRPHDAGPLA
ncbi:MAG: hypothetical protein H7332_13125, partial [Bdellovibrionales bacterium]|nr:hypothetical protein [Ramlibacter sp.]